MKRIITAIIISVIGFSATAETVSQKQAMRLAQLFFNESSGRVVAPPKLVYNGKKLTTGRLFTPFYVYNNMTGGFVIIAGDNKAFPILGFSLKESFDPESLGESETALLKSYAREIELIRYDSEPVEETKKAWINYPEYVDRILHSHYEATDPILTVSEAEEIVYAAEKADDAIVADIYTPLQWQEMITDELAQKQSVPILLYEGTKDYPAVIYGRQGEYFRIEMSRRNNWLMRLNATEIIPANMVSAVTRPLNLENEIPEVMPFEDYDSFIAEIEEHEEERRSKTSIDKVEISSGPLLRPLGSGHYEVILPEEVRMAAVYNIGGSLVKLDTYKEANVVNIDITPEPRGFYFLTVMGESGTPYGFKLYR